MINGWNFFNQPVKNSLITCDNIRKIATGQGDDYTTECLLDYSYFKNYYKMIAIDLSKQQELVADSKTAQRVNFTTHLNLAGNTTISSLSKKQKKLFWIFHKELWKYYELFYFSIISV